MNDLHEAIARVNSDTELTEYFDILINYDWSDEDHFEWVATADREELLDWCEVVSKE